GQLAVPPQLLLESGWEIALFGQSGRQPVRPVVAREVGPVSRLEDDDGFLIVLVVSLAVALSLLCRSGREQYPRHSQNDQRSSHTPYPTNGRLSPETAKSKPFWGFS